MIVILLNLYLLCYTKIVVKHSRLVKLSHSGFLLLVTLFFVIPTKEGSLY